VGVSQEKQEKEKRGSSPVKCVEENKTTLWGEGTTSKKSSHEHERVYNVMGGSNSSGMQRM